MTRLLPVLAAVSAAAWLYRTRRARDSHLPVANQWCETCQAVTDHCFCYEPIPDENDATAQMLTEIDSIGDAA